MIRTALFMFLLFAAIPTSAQRTSDPLPLLPSGATAAWSASARASDVVNLLDYQGADPTGASLSDAAFTAAIAVALARPYGAKLVLPAGNFKISAAIAVSVSPRQGLHVEGQGPGITTITQTGQSDAFDIHIARYTTKNGQFVGMKGLSLSHANARPGFSAVRITSSAVGGQQGNPIYFENCSFVGAWDVGIDITAIPSESYVSNSTFFLEPNSTGISFKGDPQRAIYSVVLMLDNLVSWGGNRFLYVGPYVQGVVARGLNVAAARQSIFYDASDGAGEQFIVTGSYLMAGVHVVVSGNGSATGVQISNNFFDGETATTNELNMIGVLQPQVTGNFFFGGPNTGGVALYFGARSNHGTITGNTFSGFMGGSGNGVGIMIAENSEANLISSNSMINATTPAVDNGTSNHWAANSFNGAYVQYGIGGDKRGVGAFDGQVMRARPSQAATGLGAVIVGGSNNSSRGDQSIAGGYENTATGRQAIALGNGNFTSGQGAAAIGTANVANGAASVSMGNSATDRGRSGSNCIATGAVEVAGDAQSCTLLLRAVTTSVSPRTLTGDGAAPDVGNCVNIPTGYAYTIEATLEGKDFSGTGNIASVVGIRGVLYRAMGSAIWSLGSVGTAQGVGTAAALLPELSADTTNQCLNLSVTPPDGNTWHWVARVKTVEVR